MTQKPALALIAAFLLIAARAVAQTPAKTPPPAPKPATATAPRAAAPVEATADDEVIPPVAPDAMFPAVVARVNGKAVLGRDLEQRIKAQLEPIGSPEWSKLRDEYRQELLNNALGALLAAELLYQKAQATGVAVTDAEVKAEYDKVQKGFASDAEMNVTLAGRGLDRAALVKELEKQLVVTRFVQENITKKVTVTPAEVEEYYKKNVDQFKHPELVRTSHILILVPDGATPEQDRATKLRADGLLARIRKGEDFAKLAKENSMDGSASQGGDIGYTPKGQLAPEYEAAAFSLPAGSVSGVVRTQFGYHIIKVTEKKAAGTSTIEEIRTELQDFLKEQKVQSGMDEMVKKLRDQAKIDLLIGRAAPAK